jgi:RNA polymerase sigma-70 factor (ECF subfamily)
MIDHIRKVKKYTVTDIYETSSIDPVYQPHHELRQTILKAINELNPTQKSLILLKDYEGYNYQEIGEIMNLSESQVKVYIHRARLQLKEKLSHLQKASA